MIERDKGESEIKKKDRERKGAREKR